MSTNTPESSNPRLLFSVDGTRYEFIRKLGQRSNSEVVLARRRYDQGPAGTVILKRLSQPHSDQHMRRLLEEAQLAYRLNHPGIAKVYQVMVHEGVPHVAMEYVEGYSLETVMSVAALRQQRMSEPFACYVVSEVAEALYHAHTLTDDHGMPLGIVHRDVNPTSIRVSLNGEVKLADFGVAYSLLPGREATTASVLRGDIAYASPERMRLERVDARSDLFSLGLVLLELLTGKHLYDLEEVERAALEAGPFSEDQSPVRCEEPCWAPVAEIAARIERFGPEDVERAAQGISSEPLRAVVHRALRRDPAERFQSGLELRDALRARLVVQGHPYGRPEVVGEVMRAVREAELLRESADVLEPDIFPELRRTEH
jgi:serine/threonine-protein kinase